MNLISRLKTESFARGMWLSVVFNILAKGILFLLTILLAAYFGSNIKTDIYFFVYGSMVLLAGFINAIDHAVLIPQSMRLRQTDGDAAAMAFLNYFLRIYIFIGLAFVVLMYFFGTRIFGWMSKFSETDIELYRNYFLLGSCYFFFLLLTNYINAILSSLKYFTIPMIISGINSCVVIAGILLLHNQLDVLSVFISGIAAFIINLIILLWILKRQVRWNYFTSHAIINRKTWMNILFAQLGQLATLASSFLPLFLLSGFGKGIISLINYGKNIADIPNTLITAQITSVGGIQFNDQAVSKVGAEMNTSFKQIGRLLIFLLIPFSGYLIVFARPLVQLLYQRGNFNSESTIATAGFLQLFAMTILGSGINALVSRIFIAAQAIKQAMFYQLTLNILMIILIWIMLHFYDVNGYLYSLIIMSIVNIVGMYFICRRYFMGLDYGALLEYAIWVIVINLPVSIFLFYTLSSSGLSPLIKIVLGSFAYMGLLVLMNQFKRMRV